MSKKILELPDKQYHPCWNSWDECLKPAQRMTDSLGQLVPNICQLKSHLEAVIRYAMVLERHLDYLYKIVAIPTWGSSPGWFDAERLDAIRAVLKERVPEIVIPEEWEAPDIHWRDEDALSLRNDEDSPIRS